jgi:hypothetical protein
MTQHINLSRTDTELLWFQRRQTLQAAAAWVAAGGWSAAQAQQRSNIVEMEGDALLNGARLVPQQTVQTGDVLQTGPNSRLVFVIGNASFHVRQNSRMTVERGNSLNTVSLLRLLTGAVVSVWGKGSDRRIVTPTLTAGIRGTGVYTEIFAEQDNRSYFCNCYLPRSHLGRQARRRNVTEPRPRLQPHGRRAGVSGTPGRPTHRLANQWGQRCENGVLSSRCWFIINRYQIPARDVSPLTRARELPP